MKRPEEATQKQLVEFLRVACPDLLFWAVPNQKGTRSDFENRLMPRLGVRAGVADLAMVLPGGGAGFVEVKAPKGALSDAQAEFAIMACFDGARYAVCRSLDDLRETLAEWSIPTREAA